MKQVTCPKCGQPMWVPAYPGDGAPPHVCEEADQREAMRREATNDA